MRFFVKIVNDSVIDVEQDPKYAFGFEVWIVDYGLSFADLVEIFSILKFSVSAHYYRKVFWYFQGVEKGCTGNEWVN